MIRPKPYLASRPLAPLSSTALWMRARTIWLVQLGYLAKRRAASAATIGQAIEVPLSLA
ncbi:hypothetical protein D3C78_1873860 [compost metagenome]